MMREGGQGNNEGGGGFKIIREGGVGKMMWCSEMCSL